MKATLAKMQGEALNRCNRNLVEARDKVVEALSNDRRFDKFDHGKLIERVEDAWGRGAQLDLDDANLLKTRPTNRYGSGRTAS